ncbi:MAG TPA: amidohydrolase family protein [Rugosimonospora sp.]|nr:amidohydrolase family protein [Rugosimonospora sp.]
MRALRAARLFDGERLHVDNPVVLLRAGTVAAVESGRNDLAGVEVTDLGDVTLLPGLVDAHAHLTFDPYGDIARQCVEDPAEVLLERIRDNACAALSSGVTTVRDLGDRDYLSLRVRDEAASHLPEILCSGPPLTRRQGHCWFLNGEAEPGDELVAAIDEHAARGVDVIKIMATGGVITPGWAPHEPQYTAADLRVAVDRAHHHGLPVSAHAHGAEGVAASLAAGVDNIEHASFLSSTGVSLDEQVVKALAASGVFVGVASARLPSNEPLSPLFQAVARAFAYQHQQGVRLVCSSDAGISPQKPFTCLPHGVVDFRDRIGMTDTEALHAATALAADSCGVGDRKGRIRAGYDADLLAVRGNPAADVTALLDRVAVYRAGALVVGSTDPSR